MIAHESSAATVVRDPFLDGVVPPSGYLRIPGLRDDVRAKPRPIHKIKSLHSRRDVDAILHRECSRCERSGQEFYFLVIGAADNGAQALASPGPIALPTRTRNRRNRMV